MTHPAPPVFPLLTICIEANPSAHDALDSPGTSKRFMIEAADRLVDDACDALPAYLLELPMPIRATSEEIRQSLQRNYRIKGTLVEIDVGVSERRLPPAWLAELEATLPSTNLDDHPVLLFIGRAIGWCFGQTAQENEKVLAEAGKEIAEERRKYVSFRICQSLLGATHAALAQRLIATPAQVVGHHGVRHISLRKSR